MRELQLKSHYDLIVIGGGIQGCAMLWEAQSRGLNALLVEAEDYCSQTSANSLKTIHGGVRYLQTLNLNRSWRSAKEQETLLRIAPHLVHPLPCLLPTERKLKRSRLAVTLGFTLYNLLKKVACSESGQRLHQARCLSKTKLAEHTDLLNLEKVTGAGFWHDAQVQHAERLGLAFVKTAQAAGAEAYNYIKAEKVISNEDRTFQIDLNCKISKKKYQVSSDSIIFCTASRTVENVSGLRLDIDKYPNFCLAVNLVLKSRYAEVAIGLQSGFAQESATGSSRLLFSAPWRDSTLFGTWYFDANSEVDATQKLNKEQIEFCLADVNQTYPGANFTSEDILMVHAGLLPVNQNGLDPENNLMESDLIHKPDGKDEFICGYSYEIYDMQSTAEETITQLMLKLGKTANKSVSAKLPLVGGESPQDFKQKQQHEYIEFFSIEVIQQLLVNYGDQINEIIQLCKQNSELAELIPGSENHIKAQLDYELEHGQVEKLSDFVFRRSFLIVDSASNRLALEYCAKRINQFHSIEEDSITTVENLLNNTLYNSWVSA